MGEKEVASPPIEVAGQKPGYGAIGEMPDPAQESLLERPGVRPNAKQLLVMIGFEDDPVTTSKSLGHRIVKVTQICGQGACNSARLKTKPDGLCCIMGNGERFHDQIRQLNLAARPDDFDVIVELKSGGLLEGACGYKHEQLREPFQKRLHPTNMVTVTVGKENRVHS